MTFYISFILKMINRYKELCENPVKKIHDCIHGYIYLSEFAMRIIDNKYFQRMRELNQLGTCKFVYPNANHTRFEHSIGTYNFAKKLLIALNTKINNDDISEYLSNINELKRYYKIKNNEYSLDYYVCELIKIAALCHDLGHGPFSHIFDDVFLLQVNKQHNKFSTHEERSGEILRMIIKNDNVLNELVHYDEINFMINLINPKNEHTGFIYQIVSNSLTGLDVDKFDYLKRDIYMINFPAKIDTSGLIDEVRIDNETLNFKYPEQSALDIANLFETRYRLHLQVYNHKAVIATQIMIVQIFILIDNILGLSESINDMDKFCNMTDDYILNYILYIKKYNNNYSEQDQINIDKAINIIERIKKRDLYKFIFKIKHKINGQEYIKYLPDKNNILFLNKQIGFVSGNKPNPFNKILFYKTKDFKTAFLKDIKDVSLILPEQYQEHFIMFYYVNNNKTRILDLVDWFSYN